MATDLKLDQVDGNWLIAEANVLKTTASDFILDSPSRRSPGGAPHRRALVHNSGDGLTINFNGDYPGGVTVAGTLAVTGDGQSGPVASVSGAIAALRSAVSSLEALAGGSDNRLGALESVVTQLADMVGAVIIPNWRTKTEVEEGDDMGISSPPAAQLGLVVEFQIDQRNPNFGHEDVISITPPAGTLVRRGSTVVIVINLEG
jgi:hypothetical protein